MSTVTDVSPANTATSERHARRGRRALLVLLALASFLVVAGGVAAGGLYAWDSGYEGRVLPGVAVGDLDLSGLTREQAVEAVAARFPYGDGSLVLDTPDGRVTIPYAAVGRRPDIAPLVDAALQAGRSGTLLERALGQVQLALGRRSLDGPAVLLDAPAATAAIEKSLAPLRVHPVNATITMTSKGVFLTRARPGRDVDAAPVTAAALSALADPAAAAAVTVPVATTRLLPAIDDAAVLDARMQADRMAQPIRFGTKSKSWTIKAAEIRSWIGFAPAPDGTVEVVVDDSQVAPNLKKAEKALKKPAKSAEYLVARSGKIAGVIASADGHKLDRGATVAAILAELDSRAAGTAPRTVRVKLAPLAPAVATSEAARKAPVMTLLGSWKTWFPISERNYFGANIWVPAKLINGTVLKPGQRFDWWDAIWPVTPARGFGPGGVIKTDHTEPTGALGGGMCSSSTTLFNAAMRAGLDMGARSNHRYYINRYPLGLDATVSISAGGGRQTMSFRNDTKGIIFIRGVRIRAGGIGWVRYEIWGVPDGRTVSISRPSVSNRRTATTRTVLVSTLPKGVREQVEYPSDGMDVAVSRVVRDRRGNVIHRDTWTSHYVLWNGIINVGR